jgi:uncharacterized RDD family membrane protein YckC
MSTGQTNGVSASSGYLGAPVVTGEAVALDLRPAGVATRGLAFVIDLAAQIFALFVAEIVLFRFVNDANVAASAAVAIVVYVLIFLGYPVLFETLTRGRTPGKMALGLRVVRDDGGPIRFRHALVRGLLGVVLEKPGLSVGTIALITMLISRSGKRLGDLAGGTIVLQERVPAHLDAPPDMPPALAGWASGLDLSGVGDDLALRVRQFLARAHDFDPSARESIGSALVAEVGSRTSAPIPPGVPGWAYLAAVLAERRNREISRTAAAPAPAPWAPTGPPVTQPPVTQPPVTQPPAGEPRPDGFSPPG